MADRDTLKRIINQELGTMGSAYRPQSTEAAVADIRTYLGQTQPLVPDDFGAGIPRETIPQLPQMGISGAPVQEPIRGRRARETPTPANPLEVLSGLLPTPVEGNRGGRRPGTAAAAEAPPLDAPLAAPLDAPAAPQQGLGPAPQQGLGPAPQGILAQNPDIMFARPDAGAANTPAPPTGTPAQVVAQAGLGMVAQGERPPISAHAPELYDPETGTRPEEARKMGLLDRMFGEEGSDKRGSMGKALMMAGAAIMSTSGSVGEAIGAGIQAGVMTYDQAQQALRDEEREARKLGMTEEAHALNMELKRLQLDRARMGGGSGPVKPEPISPVTQAVMTAAELRTAFPGLSEEDAIGHALRKHISAYSAPTEDWMTGLQ